MTVCIGWKFDDRVYLVADSVVTKRDRPATDTSSFGEKHCAVGEDFVEESSLKIARISPNCSIACAGHLDSCRSASTFLRACLDLDLSPPQALESLTVSSSPFALQNAFALLIAFSDGASPRLFRWDSISCITEEIDSHAIIGSIDQSVAALMVSLAEEMHRQGFRDQQLLSLVLACMQEFCIQERVLEFGVGGAFSGVVHRDNSADWQKDTRYFLYGGKRDEYIAVSLICRDNGLVMQSPFLGGAVAILNSASGDSSQSWMARWNFEGARQVESLNFDYWVFLNTQWFAVTVVEWTPSVGPSDYMILTGEHPNVGVQLTVDFEDFLTKQPHKVELGQKPMSVHFLSDMNKIANARAVRDEPRP